MSPHAALRRQPAGLAGGSSPAATTWAKGGRRRTAAAALHGLDGFEEGPIELLVPRRIRGRAAVGSVTSSPHLSRLDVVTLEGDLRVTSGTRTILELAGRVTERELANAVDSACRKG